MLFSDTCILLFVSFFELLSMIFMRDYAVENFLLSSMFYLLLYFEYCSPHPVLIKSYISSQLTDTLLMKVDSRVLLCTCN